VVNKTIGASFPSLPSGYFILMGGADFKLVGCILFMGLCLCCYFGFNFTSPDSSFILGEKTRPYVKTLPMPKCLSPATPNPDLPLWVHRWLGQPTGSTCRLTT
uniref:Uncharacterized protein n=1 Tax=Propithecus coquereli TaxID=379532 RepID=A0A2K6EHJ4_PROCO